MLASYRHLLTQRGVVHLVVAASLARLGPPVLSLALLLAVVDKTGSYGVAGLVLTCHALALALCAPVSGRLVDRIGPRRVLIGSLIAQTGAYGVLLLVLLAPAPPWTLLVGAGLVGATNPPTSVVIRGMWPRLVPATSLGAAYAMDNVTNELSFVAGPLVVSALQLVMSAQMIVTVAGGAVLAGAVFLAGSNGIRRSPTDERTPGRARRSGLVNHRPVLMVLTVAALGTFVFGCLRIATAAAAAGFDAAGAAGILMGLLSAGTVAGALVYGARTWSMTSRRFLIVLCVVDSVFLLADAFAPTLTVLALLIIGTGFVSGVRETLQPAVLAQLAPASRGTEAFAWLTTVMWAGYGLGTAVAGQLTPHSGSSVPAFGAAAAAALLAAAVTTLHPLDIRARR